LSNTRYPISFASTGHFRQNLGWEILVTAWRAQIASTP
jgi:hypothetical protein